MVIRRALAASLALLVLSAVTARVASAQPKPGDTAPTEALRVQYADGKSSVHSIKLRGNFYTASFPRVTGVETARDGLPLAALHVRYLRDAQGVRVQVGLAYGRASTHIETIAETRLSGTTPVSVNELRGFGVEPIVLSLVPIAETNAAPAEGVSPSPQVEIQAEPLGTTGVSYRITVRNRSSLALRSIDYVAQRPDGSSLSGSKRGPMGGALVAPGESYEFDLTVSPGRQEASAGYVSTPVHRVEILSLIWQDGLVEGDRARAARHAQMLKSHVTRLQALITSLQGSSAPSFARLRTDITRHLDYDFEMQGLQARLLKDLDSLEASGKSAGDLNLTAWLTATIAECEGWMTRIVMPKL